MHKRIYPNLAMHLRGKKKILKQLCHSLVTCYNLFFFPKSEKNLCTCGKVLFCLQVAKFCQKVLHPSCSVPRTFYRVILIYNDPDPAPFWKPLYVIHLYHLLFLAHLGLLGSERINMMRRQVWRLAVSPV